MDRKKGHSYSRPPLARILRLHEWLMEGRHPNCRKIAEEFEVSAKTVQRDINFMRDQMRLPIEYDKARFGFCYTRVVLGFPGIGGSPGKRRANHWKQSLPPALGERPSLAAAGRTHLAARIRFDAGSARAVRARTWHATQVLHALPDGSVDMTLRVRDECEIARWILGWSGHAWVIDPPQLRNRVRKIARDILARH